MDVTVLNTCEGKGYPALKKVAPPVIVALAPLLLKD